jgi:hypothetical protein
MRPIIGGSFQAPMILDRADQITDARDPLLSLIRSDRTGAPNLEKPFLGPLPASKVWALAGTDHDWENSAKAQACAWRESRFFSSVVSLPASTSHHLRLVRGIAVVTVAQIDYLPVPTTLGEQEQNAWLLHELRAGGGERFVYVESVTAGAPGSDQVTWEPAAQPLPKSERVTKFDLIRDASGQIVQAIPRYDSDPPDAA